MAASDQAGGDPQVELLRQLFGNDLRAVHPLQPAPPPVHRHRNDDVRTQQCQLTPATKREKPADRGGQHPSGRPLHPQHRRSQLGPVASQRNRPIEVKPPGSALLARLRSRMVGRHRRPAPAAAEPLRRSQLPTAIVAQEQPIRHVLQSNLAASATWRKQQIEEDRTPYRRPAEHVGSRTSEGGDRNGASQSSAASGKCPGISKPEVPHGSFIASHPSLSHRPGTKKCQPIPTLQIDGHLP